MRLSILRTAATKHLRTLAILIRNLYILRKIKILYGVVSKLWG